MPVRGICSLSLSLSLALSYLSASPFRQRDIISSWLLAHRRTTDNSAKLRAGCLIARHSGSANSRCIRRSRNSAAAGYLLNPLLHRFAKPVRIPDKVHWTVARISITIAHREMESLFHRLFSLALSLSLFFFPVHTCGSTIDGLTTDAARFDLRLCLPFFRVNKIAS